MNIGVTLFNTFYIFRLHVHTLAYQAILVERKSRWKNTRVAAVKSSLTANRHVCASNEVRISTLF